MQSPSDPSVEACVEAICSKGCRRVRSDIAQLEAGRSVPEASSLSSAQRARLLVELRQIMAVYGDACPFDMPPD